MAQPGETSGAGASARREHERRKAKREAGVRERYPRLGGVILALRDDKGLIKQLNAPGAVTADRATIVAAALAKRFPIA